MTPNLEPLILQVKVIMKFKKILLSKLTTNLFLLSPSMLMVLLIDDQVAKWAVNAKSFDPFGHRADFLSMVHKAKGL